MGFIGRGIFNCDEAIFVRLISYDDGGSYFAIHSPQFWRCDLLPFAFYIFFLESDYPDGSC